MTSSNPFDRAELTWRVARACEGGACVRVASSNGMILVGDTKKPDGPVLAYQGTDWKVFIDAVKNGCFDDVH